MGPDVGDEAPDFTARDNDGQPFTLGDFRGKKNVLLLFYPYAFTRTCTTEFCTLRDENADLVSTDDLEVVGISCDTVAAVRAWKAAENYPNLFLSDFWPHGAVAKLYNAFDDTIGTAVRCTFLIDRDGIVRYVERNTLENLGVARDQNEWRRALASVMPG